MTSPSCLSLLLSCPPYRSLPYPSLALLTTLLVSACLLLMNCSRKKKEQTDRVGASSISRTSNRVSSIAEPSSRARTRGTTATSSGPASVGVTSAPVRRFSDSAPRPAAAAAATAKKPTRTPDSPGTFSPGTKGAIKKQSPVAAGHLEPIASDPLDTEFSMKPVKREDPELSNKTKRPGSLCRGISDKKEKGEFFDTFNDDTTKKGTKRSRKKELTVKIELKTGKHGFAAEQPTQASDPLEIDHVMCTQASMTEQLIPS